MIYSRDENAATASQVLHRGVVCDMLPVSPAAVDMQCGRSETVGLDICFRAGAVPAFLPKSWRDHHSQEGFALGSLAVCPFCAAMCKRGEPFEGRKFGRV